MREGLRESDMYRKRVVRRRERDLDWDIVRLRERVSQEGVRLKE